MWFVYMYRVDGCVNGIRGDDVRCRGFRDGPYQYDRRECEDDKMVL